MHTLKNRVYYRLKPYLPWSLRIALRRYFARRTRAKSADHWPIDTNASLPPQGWRGWPDSKGFAVILTHDVEGPKGLENCHKLAELEISLGFRSSFNFIPEGSYEVPVALRTWLIERGFEVGVHDLNHDGYLYSSRADFLKKAARINHYINAWNACGFRSGFMLRNLDWIHNLNVSYDSSTFDTDPFEPQPEGASTIFPFWVPPPAAPPHPQADPALPQTAPSGGRSSPAAVPLPSALTPKGYIELPYTLPQDSSLFVLLQEPTNEIWCRKLDWIAAQGGMALLNVHPDYLDFTSTGGAGPTVRDHYTAFLQYLVQHYRPSYWHGLPLEAANFARECLSQSRTGIVRSPTP